MLLNSKAEQKSAGVRISGVPDRGGAADCPAFAFPLVRVVLPPLIPGERKPA